MLLLLFKMTKAEMLVIKVNEEVVRADVYLCVREAMEE